MKPLFALLIAVSFGPLAVAEDVIDSIQNASVTIRSVSDSSSSRGSGILFSRKDGDVVRTFCWTAGHCLDNLRKEREVNIRGDKKTAVEFLDASVVSEIYEDGRRIGETSLDARILKYSDSENGQDVGLLEIRKKNYVPLSTSVEFFEGTPKLGAALWHVGSLYGDAGAGTLTEGIMSKVGRVLPYGANGTIFDQVAVTAVGGSSGGGVFTKADGKCIGLLVRGAQDGQFNFIVPVRRLRDWAQEVGVEWAMDRDVPMPSDKELRELPIEDASAGGLFGPDRSEAVEAEFPRLIRVEK